MVYRRTHSCTGEEDTDLRLEDGKCGYSECDCTLTVGDSSVSIRADGVNVATISLESHCGEGGYTQNATVSSNQSWCSPNITSVGSSKRILISCDVNTSTSSRSATVTVRNSCGASKTISVTQEGRVVCTLTAFPVAATFPARMAIGQEKQINVTSSTGEFDVEKSSTWIIISDKTSSGFKIGVSVNLGAERSESISVTNSCGERKTINVTQSAGETPSLTGSLYCTVQLVAANCCNISKPISFSGTYSLNGGSRKVIGTQPIGSRFLLESGLKEGSYTVDLRVTAVQCDGTSLATSLNPVEGHDSVTVKSGASIGDEATAYFNLNTTCS